MEPVVTIAIPDLAGPAARKMTLASLTRHTSEPYEVVLLAEESGEQDVLAQSGDYPLRRIEIPAPLSVPLALNRLLASSTAPYLLLLESGAVVTAGWLERLLRALDAPAVGLSGPSTNSCWNEQRVLSGPEGRDWSVGQIDRYAATLAVRYKNQVRSLDTLHSLGDFCYLFKRSVAEFLGGFDEAYGAGPCWEIDFTTRAARAGSRAVWVVAAYVHRSPAPSARESLTLRLFSTNKHLYQDRFCGLRLRGEKTNYKSHCRGEACEHFAPRHLVQIVLPGKARGEAELQNSPAQPVADWQESGQQRAGTPTDTFSYEIPEADAQVTAVAPQNAVALTSDLPLVSCIMPTRNRRDFVRQALLYFERQDYPNRELVVVDDGTESVADLIPADGRFRYIALSGQLSLGAKRNIACEHARGAIIAHWDDDDWYAPHRLRHQVTPLLEKQADITGLETSCFFDLTCWEAWTCTAALHQRLFVGDVHGGTLVYWRRVWQDLAQYPMISLAEDARFLQQACRRGARLQKLPHANSFAYIRHGSNAWKFPLGSYLHPSGWQHTHPQYFIPPDDLAFYTERSPAAPPLEAVASSGGHNVGPLVSCIMPTYQRRRYVPQAIAYFLRQDYPHRELIILDDGEQSVQDLIPPDPRIRYLRLEKRLILGAKRNRGCAEARGTLIAHWDDDDWMAPHRLRYQVEALEQAGVDLCGANRQLYYKPATKQAWLYEYPPQTRRWLAGNTLCYRKTLWERHPFPEVAIGEDTRFVWSTQATKAVTLPDHRFYIGLVHEANTCRKTVTGPYWQPQPVEEVHQLLGSDLAFYLSLGGEGLLKYNK